MYGDPSVPILGTIQLPIGLLRNRGHPYTIRITNVENKPFEQTYTLLAGPKS
jgi:hypothetical protein